MIENQQILSNFFQSNLYRWKKEEKEKLNWAKQNIFAQIDGNTDSNRLKATLEVAAIALKEIGLGFDTVIALILQNLLFQSDKENINTKEIEEKFGKDVLIIIAGLKKINALDTKTADIHSENYRKLLLAMAGDVRVVFLKISNRLHTLHNLDKHGDEEKDKIIKETKYLYAPLAHRMGLYKINSNLLDLCLKHELPNRYNYIVNRLQETQKERANFTAEFVKPIQKKLERRNLDFSLKARTKSISSINNKMQKKEVAFDEVMDLFAIRIILNSTEEDEKSNCWLAYSIVTEEYQTNTNRLRDWITIPKSNGYESLHTTVLGPQGKWVEVQIRSQRMDEIAEKGLAAHWKYKGGKSSKGMDDWLMNIRDILENPELNIADFIDQFNSETYSEEVFAFTPKGDLKRLRKGATILDFAYEIHSELGDKCVGGLVNGEKVTLKYELNNGDYIAIETSNKQKPNVAWLDFVKTSKARNRIKAKLNEERKKQAAQGREMIERKFKNWKIKLDDEVIRKILKHYNYKLAVDFYYDIAVNKIDSLQVKSLFVESREQIVKDEIQEILHDEQAVTTESDESFLVIDNNIKNVNYKLAPCCNPIFGDSVFGFVTIRDGIKIHRKNCPNAKEIMSRYPYRVIQARWRETVKSGTFSTFVHISGTDRQNLITNIMHVINKDVGCRLLSINVNSDKGKFEGVLRVSVSDTNHLDFIISKIQQVKGVINVTRGEK